MTGKSVHVSGTIGLFTVGLSHILREHLLKDPITLREHWEFTQTSERSECGSPGKCSWHGKSDEFIAEQIAQHGTGPWPDCDRHYTGICYQTIYKTYTATGEVMVRGEKVDIRVYIEETYAESFGCSIYDVIIWLRTHEGVVTRGGFGLQDDGRPYVRDRDIPAEPPSDIAFAELT